MMATFARIKGASVLIIDTDAEKLTPDAVAERLKEIKPLLVAVVAYGHQPSASTQNMPAAGAICTAIKAELPGQAVILTGGHVAALPERTLKEEAADFVAGGEGLYTLIDLIGCLKTNLNDIENVRGLWYRDNGQVRSNVDAPLIRDLDGEMPGIAWDLLPMGNYRAHNWHCFGDLDRQPYAAIYTTLGCPFHCSFCCIQAPFKTGEALSGLKASSNSYRFWSPEAVIAEIDILVNKYGVRNIKIADEMFVLNLKHVVGICDLIIERGYDLNIWAYSRVDTIKPGMLEKLKAAGVLWLAFGIEAANARVRDDVQKGFDQDDVQRTITMVQDAGINVIGNYIFGLPEDDLQTMQETLDLAIDLNCEFGNFYCTMAYPGSQLYTSAVNKGINLPGDWSAYSQHAVNTLPLPTRYLSAAEVVAFRDRAFDKYFTNEAYLKMIESKFGPDTVKQVFDMTAYKLKRCTPVSMWK